MDNISFEGYELRMTSAPIVVVGAGAGGMAAAALIASRGLDVTVLERGANAGGKLRTESIAGRKLDVGPTVLTMRWVFDELFAELGSRFDEEVVLRPAEIIARHWFADGSRLDLFASLPRTIEAIRTFAGDREAEGYARFCRYARRIFETVDAPFLRGDRPTLRGAVAAARDIGLGSLVAIDGHRTLVRSLGDFFRDPRLIQLFARYATYTGSSPWLAPATLNVIAHVEREGVFLPEGGMAEVGLALRRLAERAGVRFRYGADVEEILCAGRAVRGLKLTSGERIEARAVVFNGDAEALARGLLGSAVTRTAEVRERSLSAITFAALADVRDFELVRHNVFFSADYEAEFAALFGARRLPSDGTIYLCAQDRRDDVAAPSGPERILCVVNAPPMGDERSLSSEEVEACRRSSLAMLRRAGLILSADDPTITTTPMDFARRYPGTGGSLYGPASHGMLSPFARAPARSRIRGLYLAGGSAHPGAGVPMAVMSGRLAARALLADLASTHPSLRTGTPGGTSMS